jgi:subtilisin family serine protease
VDLNLFTHLASVHAEPAWAIAQGAGVLIAVIDSGVNYNHPALAPAIQLNESEIPGNGIDDDGNGFIDDVLGYDFVNSDAYPYDDEGHGSHVAGLALGRPFGLARAARLLPVKALSPLGGDIGSIAAAVRYAADRGARVINMSFGATTETAGPVLASALAYAESKGALVVAAAGNGDGMTGLGYDIDQVPVYPAVLPDDGLLTVGACDRQDSLAIYSNFGALSVDMVAPGGLPGLDPIRSVAYENPRGDLFADMTGTSMAAPLAAGVAAQVLSLDPDLTAKQIKDILMEGGETVDELRTVTVSGRRLDALGALNRMRGLRRTRGLRLMQGLRRMRGLKARSKSVLF